MTRTLTALALVLALALSAGAGEPPGAEEEEPRPPAPREVLAETHHTAIVGGEPLSYTATAGTLVLRDEAGEAEASIFFVSYTRDDGPAGAERPVTFCFNGGPGSSSVWLHLGALGPRRVVLGDPSAPRPPPYRLADNGDSLLDVTDLVFVDPVTTGYSRVAPDEDPERFHGVEGDVASVGEFVRLYATRFRRWTSPKFLVGESYGTTRAAALARHLQQRAGMVLNGIALISPVLDFQTILTDPGNDLPYVLFLPSYTATAWYHGRLGPDLQAQPLEEALGAAEAFARETYGPALLQGSAGPEEGREPLLVPDLARFTGLPAPVLRRNDLRVPVERYTKELLRPREQLVGRFDGRITGGDWDPAGDASPYDPSFARVEGPFTAAVNHYVRQELAFESDLPYEVLAAHRVQPWNFGRFQNRYLNVAEALRRVATETPFLKIFVACGYYDLATPYLAAEYTLEHLRLDPALEGNVTLAHYPAGHMMYLHGPSRAALKRDLAAFVRRAVPPRLPAGE